MKRGGGLGRRYPDIGVAGHRGLELDVRGDLVDAGDEPVPLQVPARVVQVAGVLYIVLDLGGVVDGAGRGGRATSPE